MNALDVNSIPRFILIDPDGNIVETEAPRPSYEKTRKLLESLLNENELIIQSLALMWNQEQDDTLAYSSLDTSSFKPDK